MVSHTGPSVKLSANNTQARSVATPETAARSSTTPSQCQAGRGARQQGTSRIQDENMRSKASRAGPSEQASTAPSIPSWLYNLPSEVSGYSSTDHTALVNPHTPSGRQPNAAPRPTLPHPAQPSRATDARRWPQAAMTGIERLAAVQQSASVNYSSDALSPSAVIFSSDAFCSSDGQSSSEFNGSADANGLPKPSNAADAHNATVAHDTTVFHYHRTTNAPHIVHTHNNQRHIVDNSRRDTITQSMEKLHLNPSSGPKSQMGRRTERVDRPQGPLIKYKRGLFFDKGITTHQHVPDNRPC
ncbi:hypothetical protein LA080_013838 [Diaporthe eres]|nr:hypothetical protein LA080_013838 [Diaporthe eres]